ncbi:hypothetical protein FRB95_011785 [Tulasnella sp. JGI-2019a]|nr:hypothetical protein FRB93_000250 [Tulasnella sp. JGI-2019a]KAG9039200.1 hypothetical protein FRB95_011785 [Tulasnella sp. JGI-2019a]
MIHTEYLQYESGKFSKSRNVGVFGPGARETGVPPSVWRYYLLSTRPETSDSIFSWNDFITANNSVLLNNFGNFVNRVLKFIQAKFDGVLPDAHDAVGPYPIVDPQDPDHLDPTFVPEVNQLLAEYVDAMESVKLRLSLHIVMQISNRGNQYLQRSGLGNALLTNNPKGCAQVVSRAVNLIYALSALVHPFMPGTSRDILEQINAPARTVPLVLSNDILAGHKLGVPAHLFTKIDEKKAEEWRARFGGDSAKAAPATAKPDAKAAGKKKAAAAAKKAPVEKVDEGPKSEEVIALEAEVKAQGEVVRKLKEALKGPDSEGKPSKGDLDIAVAELLRLKSSLLEAHKPTEVAA